MECYYRDVTVRVVSIVWRTCTVYRALCPVTVYSLHTATTYSFSTCMGIHVWCYVVVEYMYCTGTVLALLLRCEGMIGQHAHRPHPPPRDLLY